jgi:hypothetical protein
VSHLSPSANYPANLSAAFIWAGNINGNTPGAPSFWHILRSSDNTYQGIQLGATGQQRLVRPAQLGRRGRGPTPGRAERPTRAVIVYSLKPLF